MSRPKHIAIASVPGGGPAPLHIIRVRCRGADDFRKHYLSDTPHGGMFCPVTEQFEPGTAVVVELICRGLPNRVLIRGDVVSWRPALPRKGIRAGAVVHFNQEETVKRDFVLETLGGLNKRPPPKRKHARLPIGQPVKVLIGADKSPIAAELRELSVVGALIACEVQPPLGTDMVLLVVSPGGETTTDIAGKALYHAGPGLTGIKFLFREGGGSRRLRELVRRFKLS